MPREGTKTDSFVTKITVVLIEIKYAPGGDENRNYHHQSIHYNQIEIKYAPGGDENKN